MYSNGGRGEKKKGKTCDPALLFVVSRTGDTRGLLFSVRDPHDLLFSLIILA